MLRVNFAIYSIIFAISLTFISTAECEGNFIDALNTQNKNISGWYEGWGSEPIEATVRIEKNKAVIGGASQDKAFGSVHKNVTIDLNKYSLLEIEVKSVNYYWYLIVSGKQFLFNPTDARLAEGCVLLEQATNKTGKYKYNLKKITGLTGKQKFDLQIGVGRQGGDNNIGCEVVIKSLKFINPN